MSNEASQEFEKLLEYLKQSRGFDFTSYKRPSLMRRIEKRMQMVGIGNYEQYLDYLEVHPDEFSYLFNMILINVTGFFRDAHAWEYLSGEIIPKILAAKAPTAPIRVWIAGCASGEEAYTVAMVFAEVLGLEQFVQRVKIYATDLDEEALNCARLATYGVRLMGGIPPELLTKYFEQVGQRYIFHKDLRRSVIFGRHDLIQDAPISRVDLITCRNTLMYFNTEAQARTLARFHFALNSRGYLFLGKAEMLFAHTNLFAPVDIKRRVFSKRVDVKLRDRMAVMAQTAGDDVPVPVINNNVLAHVRIREAAFEADPLPQMIINIHGVVMFVNDRARLLFGIDTRDIGRPLQDLEISYRPVELRSCIDTANQERRTVTVKDVEWRTAVNDVRYYDVQVIPLIYNGDGSLGVKVIFSDVSRWRHLQEELRQSKQDLETAYEELQSSNEELVTTNEELQSTIEELETTNEELQSTNEELETTNEELQSSNEELETMNGELQQQGEDFTRVNTFLQSILMSVPAGVIVVDRDLCIEAWNPRCIDLWGLRTEEVLGTHLLSLDSGLPVEQLGFAISSCLTGENRLKQLMVNATNRRGKAITCRLACTPLVNPDGEIQGAMILIEEKD